MNGLDAQLDWQPAQRTEINDEVTTVVNSTRVAASFLQVHTLESDAKFVPADTVNPATGEIDDETTLPLAEISIEFSLDRQQVSEPGLSKAKNRARWAARAYSRLEDALLFNGQPARGVLPPGSPAGLVARLDRGQANNGLRAAFTLPVRPLPGEIYGARIIRGVGRALGIIEAASQAKPYALFMSTDLYDETNTPSPAFVLPRDRIESLVDSNIVRSPVLPARTGLLMALAGDPVDRAVAVEPTTRFLGVDRANGRFYLSVYGVTALRLKESNAVVVLRF